MEISGRPYTWGYTAPVVLRLKPSEGATTTLRLSPLNGKDLDVELEKDAGLGTRDSSVAIASLGDKVRRCRLTSG